jgi:hypothetical protein
MDDALVFLVDVLFVVAIALLLAIVGSSILKNRATWGEIAEAISAKRYLWWGISFAIFALGVASLIGSEDSTVSQVVFCVGFAGMGIVHIVSKIVDDSRERKEHGPPSVRKRWENVLSALLDLLGRFSR